MAQSWVEQFQRWLDQQQGNWMTQGSGGLDADTRRQLLQVFSHLNPSEQEGAFTYFQQSGTDPSVITQWLQHQSQHDPAAGSEGYASPTGAQAVPQNAYADPAAQAAASQAASSSTAPGAGAPWPGTPQAAQATYNYATGAGWELAGGNLQDPAFVGQQVGMDPQQLRREYQAYVSNFNDALTRRMAPGFTNYEQQSRMQQAQPMSLAQFGRSMATAVQGQWAPAVNFINYYFQQQGMGAMPPQLQQQILGALNGLPPNERAQVLHQMYQAVGNIQSIQTATPQGATPDYAATIQGFMQALQSYAPSVWSGSFTASSSAAGPGSVISNYFLQHPNIGQTAAQEKNTLMTNAIAMLTQYGITPTNELVNLLAKSPDSSSELSVYLDWMAKNKLPINAEAITKLLSMPFADPSKGLAPEGTGGSFLQTMPSPISGMNMGVYSNTLANINGAGWDSYFKTGPSHAQVAMMSGWSGDRINEFIMNSPSSYPGITNGQYQDYSSIWKKYRSDMPGGEGQFMNDMHLLAVGSQKK